MELYVRRTNKRATNTMDHAQLFILNISLGVGDSREDDPITSKVGYIYCRG